MMLQKPIVYIVDDDEAIRNALRLLMKTAGLSTQIYGSAQEFIDSYKSDIAGCLILDVRMPGMNGLDLQKMLHNQHIRIPVIIMTGHGEVSMAVQAMKNGAVDFIEKPFKNEVLLARVNQAITHDLAERAEQKLHFAAASRISTLTCREREIMALLIQGKRNKIIASELGISNRTVEAHRAKIMEKMQAHSLSDIVRATVGIEDHPANH